MIFRKLPLRLTCVCGVAGKAGGTAAVAVLPTDGRQDHNSRHEGSRAESQGHHRNLRYPRAHSECIKSILCVLRLAKIEHFQLIIRVVQRLLHLHLCLHVKVTSLQKPVHHLSRCGHQMFVSPCHFQILM